MDNVLKLRDINQKMNMNLPDKYLDTVFLKNITLNKKKKKLKIDIFAELFIKKEIFEVIEKTFREGFPELKVFLNLHYKNFREIDIDRYIEDLLKEIRKLSPSISKETVHLYFDIEENKLEIKINSKVIYDYISKTKIKDSIKEKISKEFCENIAVKLLLEENTTLEENHIENKNKEERDLITKHKTEIDSVSKPKEKSPQFQNTGKPKYNKRRRSLIQLIEEKVVEIKGLNIDLGTVCIKGEVFHIEIRDLSNGTKLMTFSITDFKDSINCKIFLRDNFEEVSEIVKEKSNLKVLGDITYDNYSRQNVIMVKGIQELEKTVGNMDTAENKRVELHAHTKMSSMDGIVSASDLISKAAKWGHKAIAITDHGVLQSYPEAMYAGASNNIKIIYGVEGYLLNDKEKVSTYRKNRNLDDIYTVFDIETTGFSSRNNKIIEIGAVKISNGKIIDNFSEFIDPEEKIPERITELTGIDNSMVEGKGKTKEVLEKFLEFIEDSILVAHNASFDMAFIREKAKVELGIEIENDVLDTVSLSRSLFHDLKNHRLNTVAKYLNISLKNHHRAVDDAKATSEIFLKSIEILKNENIENLEQLNDYCIKNRNFKTGNTNHIIILAKNLVGLKNLYKLVSESHIENFYKKPRINKSSLEKYREGLILGSACEGGELYRKILKNSTLKDIEETASFYDFLEVQSLKNNDFLIRKGEVKNIDELIQMNKQIIELGKKYNKLVVATGDVHFLNPKDEIYRRILMTGQGFSDGDNQAPLYFKTTDEMLSDFYYLSQEEAYEIVVENTNKIADMIENLKPIPDGTYPPIIEGSDDDLRNMTYKKAKSIYGDQLPEIVEARLERELNSIIKNGYAVMYIIAQKLVGKSLEDGYLVGSRGSVGSSFAATMSDITEVNPLAPHYICENCKYSEFITDGSYGSGIDLPDKNCPECGNKLIKDGHSIPFEVFLGFEGDKEPDIDLNFAGEYQSVAHKYTEELFGEGKVFRAGTIGTIAEKTAYGFVKKYFDSKEEEISGPEINRLVKGCTGIKRTSGQHPGGIMVVPDYKDIYDFTPIQHPADDKESGVITTHFDYNAISGRILKLDILGHDVPSIIRMLEDLTGIKPEEIPLDDVETMKLFIGTESLGIEEAEIGSITGTLGIPEFGTKFVRQMLIETKPSTFEELVRISGLSHGTDVWINNAQELVKSNIAPLKEVICTRDDIMNYLILKGMDKKLSFKIMEKVRKGRPPSEEEIEDMIKNDVPSWYIESCQKIKYMFPKAHAVAYVMMSFRIAYFKVHQPLAFYATYFSTKINDFSIEIVSGGIEGIRKKIEEIEKLGNGKTAKEKNLNTVLEVALEMLLRGYEFKKVDIYKSLSHKFSIEDNKILPPLKSLEGVGDNLAKNIVLERDLGEFISVENMINRTKATKSAIDVLKANGCLNNLQETNQIDLFSI